MIYPLKFTNTFYYIVKKEGFICKTYLYPNTLHNILMSDSMLDFPLSRHTLCKFFLHKRKYLVFLKCLVSDMYDMHIRLLLRMLCLVIRFRPSFASQTIKINGVRDFLSYCSLRIA